MIRFKFNPAKAVQGIRWMLLREPRLDFHTLLKAFYFADKKHLNAHGRPVFGASYRAMNFGPVPLEVYEMLKQEPYWLSEINEDGYPWCTQGYHVSRVTDEPVEMDLFSREDLQSLEFGFERSSRLTFSSRTRETHGKDWVKANLGMMRYEDMLDDGRPDRDELIQQLERVGTRIAL